MTQLMMFTSRCEDDKDKCQEKRQTSRFLFGNGFC